MVGDCVALAVARSPLIVTVLCPLKCVVASYRFRSANTGVALLALQHVGGFGAFAVHVDGEAGVDGEERLLSFGVSAIGAMRVGVEQLAIVSWSAASEGVSSVWMAISDSPAWWGRRSAR